MMYLMLLKSVVLRARMLHDHANRRRHEKNLRNAVRLDQLQRGARIELGDDDVRRAGAQPPNAVADTADVETRHRNETDVAVSPVVPLHVVVRWQRCRSKKQRCCSCTPFGCPVVPLVYI